MEAKSLGQLIALRVENPLVLPNLVAFSKALFSVGWMQNIEVLYFNFSNLHCSAPVV